MTATTYDGGAWATRPTSDTQKKDKFSWAQAAGRKSGKEGYRFGDGTRALFGALRGKKETRMAISNLFGDKHKGSGAGDSMGVMPTPDPLFKSTAELRPGGVGPNVTPAMTNYGMVPPEGPSSVLDGVWLGFFNSTHAVGRLALGAGELSVDAIEDAEPSVLIGLPALASLECAIRSAAASKEGKLVTFDGKQIGRTMLSAGAAIDRARGAGQAAADALALFDTMLELAQRVGGCRLSAAGLASLRARALAVSGTDARVELALEPAEEAEVNGLVALSQSVATRLSQMPLYKRAFNTVLEALADEQRHEADMIKMMAAVA